MGESEGGRGPQRRASKRIESIFIFSFVFWGSGAGEGRAHLEVLGSDSLHSAQVAPSTSREGIWCSDVQSLHLSPLGRLLHEPIGAERRDMKGRGESGKMARRNRMLRPVNS